MKVRIKGMYAKNRTIPEESRGRTYDITTLKCGVNLSEDGLTILLSDTRLSKSLKGYFELRKFKGIAKLHKQNKRNKCKGR